MTKRQTNSNATPTLVWPGKRMPEPISLCPARLAEIFEPEDKWGVANHDELAPCPLPRLSLSGAKDAPYNSLFLGDNRDVLTYLLANGYRGQVKLIYIDPPFDSGAKYRRKVRLRGAKAPTMQTSADHVFGEQAQFNDRWSENGYLQFMYERLPLLRDLLAEDGSLWLHCDHRQAHHLRVLLQEIFGADNYLNTVAWRSQVARGAKVNAFYFPYSTHYLEIFAKDRRAPTTWHLPKKQIILSEAEAAREFMRDERGFFRTSDPGTYSFARLKSLQSEGRLYAPFGGEIVIDETARHIYASKGGNIGVKYYLTDLGGKGRRGKWAVERAIDNLWDDIPGLGTTPGEDLGYPTQKTEALLERIIRTSTNPGDLVLDCFMGSGTTLAVAQQLGRRWLGCDNNHGALLTARRRLQAQALTPLADAPGFAVYHLATEGETNPVPQAQSLEARIEIVRNPHDGLTICIEILDVASPGIATLLAQSSKGDKRMVDGWRSLVDCVAIDPAYDGQVFHNVLVDAPLKKSAQVKGSYTVPGPAAATRVAVRITDLLGEEVVVTKVI